ncbi:calcium-binding protein [Phenylobacterium sp.]|jgi:Ca2+-binding RTX toxin-like protein|uniref:calcium-binding protein n=1 Tax=Phenylobacterium sp. TaxID=1871053 RepID=UPI002F9400EA
MSTGSYTDLLRALGQNESGNNYAFVSSVGYLGRFQFGEEALKAIGFYEGNDGTGAIDFIGKWTGKAASFGVFDKASFLASPAAQDAAQQAWFENIHADLKQLDLLKYVGQWVDGGQVTMSGLIAGAHLVGVWNLKDYLATGGAMNMRDPYGTPVSEYVKKFAGYDTPWAGGSSSTSTAEVQAPAATGNDWFNGQAWADTHHGGAGDDTLVGNDGGDYLRGDDGRDSLSGGADFDDLNGNAGDDTLSGGWGDDWVVGGRDNDLLSGDDGADIVLGNLGADTVAGGAGADVVRGGQGDDFVQGGDGNDWLAGDRGADVLIGGGGADTFHIFGEAEADRVLDFNYRDGDRVDAQGNYWVQQVGADTVLTVDGGAQLTLVNVQLSSLGSDWIF